MQSPNRSSGELQWSRTGGAAASNVRQRWKLPSGGSLGTVGFPGDLLFVALDGGDELDGAARSVVDADCAIWGDLADDQVRHGLARDEIELGRAVGDGG